MNIFNADSLSPTAVLCYVLVLIFQFQANANSW